MLAIFEISATIVSWSACQSGLDISIIWRKDKNLKIKVECVWSLVILAPIRSLLIFSTGEISGMEIGEIPDSKYVDVWSL